ncbi:hypothetical protein C0J52_12276 [Blattella germanica]|nr:hypothetical protein C0J52_12276 [Blattella germanica]
MCQGQKNTDVFKSVGLLLMSSMMEVSRLEQRAYIKTAVLRGQNVTHHANIFDTEIESSIAWETLPYTRRHSQRSAARDYQIGQWAMEQLMVLVVFLIVSSERFWRLLRRMLMCSKCVNVVAKYYSQQYDSR